MTNITVGSQVRFYAAAGNRVIGTVFRISAKARCTLVSIEYDGSVFVRDLRNVTLVK